MKLPSRKQYTAWSLPSKLTFWGTAAGIVSLAFSLITYIVSMRLDSSSPVLQSTAPHPTLSLSTQTEKEICDADNFYCISDETRLTYDTKESDSEITIFPSYKDLEERYQIFYINKSLFRFPILDVKVLNNTTHSYFIDQIRFEVTRSEEDVSPFIVIDSDCENFRFNLNVQNYRGYLPYGPIDVTYTVENAGVLGDKKHLIITEEQIDEFAYASIDIRGPLLELGVKANDIREFNENNGYAYDMFWSATSLDSWSDSKAENLNACVTEKTETENISYLCSKLLDFYTDRNTIIKTLNAYGFAAELATADNSLGISVEHNNPKVFGTVKYKYMNFQNGEIATRNTPFNLEIHLASEWGCGGGEPPSGSFDVNFHVQKDPYNINLPVSQSIESKSVDRFLVSVGSDVPAYFEFNMLLFSIDGQQLESKPIKLFIPNISSVPIEN